VAPMFHAAGSVAVLATMWTKVHYPGQARADTMHLPALRPLGFVTEGSSAAKRREI